MKRQGLTISAPSSGGNTTCPTLGTGDGENLTFDFATDGITCIVVFVGGIAQSSTVWSLSAGTGPAGVDQLVFTAGNAPANGVPIEALVST